jgi:hypothetical protein
MPEANEAVPNAPAPEEIKDGMPDLPDSLNRTLTFGDRAVGLTFNPSGDPAVDKCKRGFAALIDQMDDLRKRSTGEQARHCSIAITQMEDAQMRAVKAITWRK